MVVRVLMPILVVVTDCDQKRSNDGNNIEHRLNASQLLAQDQIGKNHCENRCQFLNHANHGQTEERHRVVAHELREDALEDPESHRREVLRIHVVAKLPLCVLAHVDEHKDDGGKASEEQQLECAHAGVPRAEELASDQVVRREDRVEDEVQDGHLRVVFERLIVYADFFLGESSSLFFRLVVIRLVRIEFNYLMTASIS